MPTEVLQDMPTRIEKAWEAIRDARGAYEHRLQAGKDLIVDAVEHGMQLKTVAQLAGISRARVHAILVGSQPDDDK